ncbi:MAG: FKBP-type peptidyl-prolyl cis-trans isomerase [Bacteroidetes bacterium]|nr:FKBP-type peptidyl-prolyl cis-trans isomerase [Bacteroidota bacterium]
MKKTTLYLSLALAFLASCKGNKPAETKPNETVQVTPTTTENIEKTAEQRMEDTDKEIKEYITTHKIDTSITSTGLVYQIVKKNPKGRQIKFTDNVTVKYKGTLVTGELFDEGEFEFTAGAQQVIRGWDEGIELLKEGEKMILIVPFWLGYGEQDMGKIPPFSTLVFEMEAVKVIPSENK